MCNQLVVEYTGLSYTPHLQFFHNVNLWHLFVKVHPFTSQLKLSFINSYG